MYTEDQVRAQTLKYFNGNELATDVFIKKYCLRDNNGVYHELSPHDLHDRLAGELARIDEEYGRDYNSSFTEFREALDGFARLVPQGSPMAAIGNKFQLMSASNCVVIDSPDDSIDGIFSKALEMAQLHKRRAGVGVDISKLRPNGFGVNNAARTTTGPCSFADLYSYETRLIGQGARRGATMITINVHHPDVEEFASMKSDLKKVTGANVSVQLTDEFMRAVEKGEEYEQRWPVDGPPSFSRMVSARKVWDVIVTNATLYAEPGLQFIDTVKKFLPAHCYDRFKTITSNPCQPAFAELKVPNGRYQSKTLRWITVGDVVWSGKRWTRVIDKRHTGDKEVFSFKTNISEFIGTEDHRVLQNGIKVPVKDATHIDSEVVLPDGEYRIEPREIIEVKSLGVMPVYDITVDDPEHTYWTKGCIVSNCGEIFLSAYDACRLLSINLTGYIVDAFSDNARFDLDLFKKDIKTAMRALDNIVDLEIELSGAIVDRCDSEAEKDIWHKLRDSGRRGRRTGLGTHGLADCLAQLCIRYDSNEALTMCELIYRTLRDEAYRASVELARERSPFPEFDWAIEFSNEYISKLPIDIKKGMTEYGRRNISILTNAPTGSVSIVSKCGQFDLYNISSGIEPVFRLEYTRRKKKNHDENDGQVDFVDELGDTWQEYNVCHSNLEAYRMLGHNNTPEYFVTSDGINWEFRVKLQGVVQSKVDHSVSSTINLPKNTPVEVVKQIYMMSWKEGLKGVTVYVDGCRSGVLVTNKNKQQRDAVKRPNTLNCDIHRVTVKGQKWIVLVGLLDSSPYEVFCGHYEDIAPCTGDKGTISKRSKGRYFLEYVRNGKTVSEDIREQFKNHDYGWATRLVSAALRHGTPVEFMVEQLNKEGRIHDFNKALARVLKRYISNGKVKSSVTCPICSSTDIVWSEGCHKCSSCGYEKCS